MSVESRHKQFRPHHWDVSLEGVHIHQLHNNWSMIYDSIWFHCMHPIAGFATRKPCTLEELKCKIDLPQFDENPFHEHKITSWLLNSVKYSVPHWVMKPERRWKWIPANFWNSIETTAFSFWNTKKNHFISYINRWISHGFSSNSLWMKWRTSTSWFHGESTSVFFM